MGHSTRRFMMGAAGAGGDKKYIDEVFSTEVYKGTGTMSGSTDSGAKTITNSIDYSEGALTWLKQRSHNDNHQLFDTVRGDNKRLVWLRSFFKVCGEILMKDNVNWKADLIGSIIFFIVILSMMIEWEKIGGWFK